jgi:hypothetical protein
MVNFRVANHSATITETVPPKRRGGPALEEIKTDGNDPKEENQDEELR